MRPSLWLEVWGLESRDADAAGHGSGGGAANGLVGGGRAVLCTALIHGQDRTVAHNAVAGPAVLLGHLLLQLGRGSQWGLDRCKATQLLGEGHVLHCGYCGDVLCHWAPITRLGPARRLVGAGTLLCHPRCAKHQPSCAL